ncbi:membrane hypothetical protein [Bradyrhizobium sp. STM 3843]|uniref:hypothetical protein n=1 Tax=Bradyrhizobium sp. STM 3843 TaxID=551947 RepID=UPI00024077EC|nr:hypothetical protein [Bradyrhizobium sp. STM 3843]CCE07437.1 membrane hypothetical protein [Bradyrhizobium sp. STM 3843]
MSIDPKYVTYFGVWTSILMGIAAIGPSFFEGAIPAWLIPIVLKWCAIFAFINNCVLTGGSGFSSSKPGPWANLPATAAKPIVIIAVVITTAFLFAGTAHAQILPKPKPAAAKVDPLQKILDDISAKSATFVSGVIAAIQEADDDAATLTNPSDPASFRDPIAHACYPAQIKFLQSLPQIQAIKASAPYNVIVMFQRKRDLIAQIKAGLPGYLKVGCSALLQDEANILTQTLAMIGVTVGAGALTGIFPAAAPITLPALTLPGV